VSPIAPEDSTPSNPKRDLTPDTHVRMTLPKFWGLIVTVAASVAAFVAVYQTTTAVMNAHIANIHIHLPEDFDRTHGAPVGDRDLIEEKRQIADSIDGVIKARIDELRISLESPRRRHDSIP